MAENKKEDSMLDPTKKFVSFKEMNEAQLKMLPRVKINLKKFTTGKGNASTERYALVIEVHNALHLRQNLTEAQFVNTLFAWGKDGQSQMFGSVPIYYTTGIDKFGNPFYFYELYLYRGCIVRGMFDKDQIVTLDLLKERKSGIDFIEREKFDNSVIDEFIPKDIA